MNLPRLSPLARALSLTSITALAALTLVGPNLAEACGGTFCDAGPTVMPVDQTGESIVFWIDDSGAEPYTEAHIQIQYEGDAERFAWIIPVQQVPEVLVGSQALFDNMLQATVPTFTTTSQTIGDCNSSFGLCSFADAALAGGDRNEGFGDTGALTGSGDPTDGPEILDRGLAGAFEYVTLTGDNIQEIVDWLDEAGYAQDEDAPPILQEYLDDGFVFVAVKLRGGAETDEIHPLAIRYPGIEPCIPIKLTRIAAVDDMAIRAFFLGSERVAPQNWPHVELNHTRFDWVNGPATNYAEVVGLAIDEAGGRAFVTEYAGTDSVVSTNRVFDPLWDASAFEIIEPVDVVDVLASQGLANCANGTCTFTHPQVEPLLSTYLPAPDGMDPYEYWSCVSCFEGLLDQAAWDAQPGFAADFVARISGPGTHALAMLADSSYLTRLVTLISPHEMLDDPLFHETDGLPTVDNSITATRITDCNGGPTYFELPDGRQIAVDDNGVIPDLEGNPAAERVERVPMMGPPQVEVDNADQIDMVLELYHEDRLVGPAPEGCSLARLGFEGLMSLMGIFGIAWFNRGRRRREV